ncbi:Myb protein 1A [Ceratobasidium sp. AG-Ba]|nr:Myb protein 1A [Ceratobasidium sp. AG-Ba]QRW13885.1 Myb protein 1A [Ceratobasidium sp. AG-Ba]
MSGSPFQVALSPNDIAQAQQVSCFSLSRFNGNHNIPISTVSNPTVRTDNASRGSAEHQQARHCLHIPCPGNQYCKSRELLEVQRRPEAWGLVVPFLESSDPNVQFFGALTVQVKIARDWDAFPQEHAQTLRDTLLELAGRAAARNFPRLTTRKLFVALCSLALRIAPTSTQETESKWPNWVLGTAQSLSANGASPELVLEFLTIVAEEMARSDLIAAKKSQMDQILREAAPAVVQAASSSLGTTGGSALKCLEAWIGWGIPADHITPLIPLLIDLLSPSADEDIFAAASDVLQEILTKSALSEGGAGLRTLTIPLLDWIERAGVGIMQEAVSSADSNTISHSVCKLVTALGEHSTAHIAASLTEPRVQALIKVALGYTGFPGWYGADEDESEMVLPFWYLLEEALLDADYVGDPQGELWGTAKMIYLELVKVLKRKVTWPADVSGWAKDQREKFANYRRDVGDALINAYYVLRDDMLRALIEPLVPQLAAEHIDWEDVESTLHNIKAIQEALPVDPNPALATLFGPRVLGRLPRTGTHRVRRTALATVGAYATWFTTGARTRAGTPAPDDRGSTPTPAPSNGLLGVPGGGQSGEGAGLLLDAVGYVVAALEEPVVCSDAARALKELCDANRTRLAPHIQSFGELHQRLPRIPANEKGKVLQSIASVIQALPPNEAVDPILGVVTPVVSGLSQILNDTNAPADAARDATIAHLGALTACSKGLTRSNDIFAFALEDPDTPEGQALLAAIEQARADPRMVALRDEIVRLVGSVMARWCIDAEASTAVSELIKSITALPSDATLLSLSPEPLLELVCTAARVQLTAVWLSLAALLVVQLDPPMWPRLGRDGDAEIMRRTGVVAGATAGLVGAGLAMLGTGGGGAMEANPDVAQDFFGYLTKACQVGTHFPRVILEMQNEIADGLFRLTATALTLQERYSLVNACNFMTMFLRKTRNDSALAEPGDALLRRQGAILMEALLLGIGGSAPRSTVPNLSELLATLVSRVPAESRNWMNSLLMVDTPSNARIPAPAREKFMKTVLGTRSTKKTKEAANEYALVARGLEGSAFGYATTAM